MGLFRNFVFREKRESGYVCDGGGRSNQVRAGEAYLVKGEGEWRIENGE